MVFQNKEKQAGKHDEEWRAAASEIWHSAKAAKEQGESWFACVFVVSESSPNFGLGGPKGNVRTISPAPVLQQVETLGWRLDKADHVFVQTTGGSAGNGKVGTDFIGGVVQGHYLFRSEP
jgi:hypothetical protein